MQTFLPYRSFEQSAKCLDYRRLGKQRVEVLQLLKALMGETKGWVNHPAAKMWRGNEGALAKYGLVVCSEWKARGYKDTCYEKIVDYIANYGLNTISMPRWLGNEEFHSSHRSNLLRKDKDFYSQFNWQEPDDMEYIWPGE